MYVRKKQHVCQRATGKNMFAHFLHSRTFKKGQLTLVMKPFPFQNKTFQRKEFGIENVMRAPIETPLSPSGG